MSQKTDQNPIEEYVNQNNSLLKSIEILAEITRTDIERSGFYFDKSLIIRDVKLTNN